MLNKNFSHQKLFSITETNLKKKKQEKTWSLAGDVRIAFQSVLFVLKKNPSVSRHNFRNVSNPTIQVKFTLQLTIKEQFLEKYIIIYIYIYIYFLLLLFFNLFRYVMKWNYFLRILTSQKLILEVLHLKVINFIFSCIQ